MSLTISDTFTDLSGTPIPNISVSITPDNGFLQLIGGSWVDVDREPKTATTAADGSWSLTVPFPSVCAPAPVFWTIRDPIGRYWHGTPKEAVTGPLTLLELGWMEMP